METSNVPDKEFITNIIKMLDALSRRKKLSKTSVKRQKT